MRRFHRPAGTYGHGAGDVGLLTRHRRTSTVSHQTKVANLGKQGYAVAQHRTADAIVVGIDGSQAAITAATWAVDEAVSRDVPLHLVHVIGTGDDDYDPETEYAEESLRAAAAAVHARGTQVKVDTAILRGDVDATLIGESRDAAMICAGTTGIGRVASKVFGSTAIALATGAHCPVAVIRHHSVARDGGGIVVVVDDRAGNDEVIQQAMEEARLRKAPLLALGVWRWELGSMSYDELDQRMESWRQRYPDVQVRSCEAPGGQAEYIDTRTDLVQLLVTGNVDAELLVRLVGPHAHPILDHPQCSVLVVRH
jgi:nucleotide-binding universal stress UspA family protein